MISTTIEQSKKLVKLGLSAKTADMHYRETHLFGEDWILCPYGISYYNEHKLHTPAMYVPSWSLSALLSMLPSTINIGSDEYCLIVDKYQDRWYVRYIDKKQMGFGYNNTEIITAVYDIVCYLIEEKLL